MGLIADGADKIIAARMKGHKPADMVLVSLNGPLSVPFPNPVVAVDPEQKYDWRWVRGLDIGIYITDADEWPDIAKAIALCRPDYLCVWNHAEQWGATVYLIPTANDVKKPTSFWHYELDFHPWMDFQNKDFAAGRRYEDEQ